jgi:hypothetical protein
MNIKFAETTYASFREKKLILGKMFGFVPFFLTNISINRSGVFAPPMMYEKSSKPDEKYHGVLYCGTKEQYETVISVLSKTENLKELGIEIPPTKQSIWKLIEKYKEEAKYTQVEIDKGEEFGAENLDIEGVETQGVLIGKKELSEQIIKDLLDIA